MALLSSMMIATLPAFFFATINAGATEGYNKEHVLWRHLAPERVAVVPSSVDAILFNPHGRAEDRISLRKGLGLPSDQVVWLVVSRLAIEKRIGEVIEALKLHRETWPKERQPELVIVGDGPVRNTLQAQASKDSLPVHFLGYVPHSEVARLYRASDVCATCSVQETFGLTLIEAMACDCPQVMPHCDVFDELYGNVIGEWMFKDDDRADLVRALRAASTPASAKHLAALKQNGG
eukprot:CAMPEP_0117509868 /NCGR_PEP_ID=MMETSP0784-20121206/27698_1 /TAXON_ID=39447 /ORGANISM="" /LENGTH=234 /DNA_ID=CAMNT_0005305491 /DNA_START=339 /DNA_END=1040 /DNA_ORIENTATION=-